MYTFQQLSFFKTKITFHFISSFCQITTMAANITEYAWNYNENACRCTCLYVHILRTPATGDHLATNISVTIANILIFIPAIVLNTLVLSAYFKNRHLHTSANMLLMALSLSDLCICLFAQTLWVTKKISEIFITFNCYVWVANRLVSQGTCGVSLMIITVMSIERFATLAYPFRYQTVMTRARLKTVIAVLSTAIWVFVVCEVFRTSNYVIQSMVGGFLIVCVILILVIWFWIHRLITKHKRQIVTFQIPAMTSFKTVLRNTKTGYFISGSVFLCFFPSFVESIYYVLGFENRMIYFYIFPWFDTLLFTSSLLNPVILLYRKKDYREMIRHLLSQHN